MHETNAVIGSLTQTLKEEGAQVGNFVKSAFPRLLSSGVQSQLEAIGVSVRDNNGVMKDAIDIYQEVADKMETGALSAEQFNQTALALGGRRHITRVTALLESMQAVNGEQSLYAKQLDDSQNSAGSAYRENLVAMQSIESQQRVLIANAQQFALTAGDEGLTEMYRSLLDSLTSLTESATEFVDRFGFVTPLFTAAGAAAFAFSKRVRKAQTYTNLLDSGLLAAGTRLESVSNGFKKAQVSASVGTAGMSGFTKATKGATLALGTLATTFKSALISTGIGIAIVGVTTLIGKLIESQAKASAETRRVKNESEQLVATYEANKESVGDLVKEYETLAEKSRLSADEEERYREVQNKLGEILPNTVSNIDAKGQAHLKNVDAIKEEISYIEKLSALEAQAFVDEGFNESFDETQKKIEETQTKLNELYNTNKVDSDWGRGFDIKNDLSGQDSMFETVYENDIKNYKEQLNALYSELAQNYAKVNGLSKELSDSQLESVQSIVESSESMEDAEVNVKSYVAELTQALENVKEKAEDNKIDISFEDMNLEQLEAFDNAMNSVAEGKENWKDLRVQLIQSGVEASTATQILGGLRNSANDVSKAAKKAEVAHKDMVPVYSMFGEIVGWTARQIEDESGALDENAEAAYENITAYEMLTGKTEESADKMADAVKAIKTLSNEKNLTAQQTTILSAAEKDLAEMYPYLDGNITDHIGFIEAELNAREILSDANADEADLTMANDYLKTSTILKNTSIRIKAMERERDALQQSINNSIKAGEIGDNQARRIYGRLETISTSLSDLGAVNARASRDVNNLSSAINDLMENGTGNYKENKDAVDDSADAIDDLTVVSKEYLQALDEINAKIKEQQNLQSKYPKWSTKYQDALKKEIKLMKEKKGLIDDEIKLVEKRVKSGEFPISGGGTSSGSVGGSGFLGSTEAYRTKNLKDQTQLSAADINSWIREKGGGNSILAGTGDYFVQAAKESGLDPLYLVAHAALETGWGKSRIARDKKNFFGIGAFDGSAYSSAYGYDGVKAGIIEGAKWIARNYTNKGQNSLAKMRHNGGVHQYATDPLWDDKIAATMNAATKLLGKSVSKVESGGNSVSSYIVKAGDTLSEIGQKLGVSWKKIQQANGNIDPRKLQIGQRLTIPGGSGSGGSSYSGGEYYGSKKWAQYYLDNYGITGRFGDPRGGGTRTHTGLDFNQPGTADSGDPIYSLTGGKVVESKYSSGRGWYIAVTDEEGNLTRYVHLKHKPKYSVGDRVGEGDTLGYIGNTGNSFGSHLHIDRKENGKYIDPLPWIQGLSTKTASSGGSDGGRTQADELADTVDEAIAELHQMRGESEELDAAIWQGQIDILESRRANFDYWRSRNDDEIAYLQQERNMMNSSSEGYRRSMRAEREYQMVDAASLEREIKYLRAQRDSGRLDDTQQAMVNQMIEETKTELYSVQNTIQELTQAVVNSTMQYYEDLRNQVDMSLQKSEDVLASLSSTSYDYRKELEAQAKHMEYKQDLLHKEANYLRDQLEGDWLSAEKEKELRIRVSELGLEWRDLEQAIKDLTSEIIESRTQAYQDQRQGVDFTLDKMDSEMMYLEEGSAEYAKALAEQVKHYEYKQSLLSKEADYLRGQIENADLTTEKIKELRVRVSELGLEWWDVQENIKSVHDELEDMIETQKDQEKEAADEIVSIFRDMYRERKDAALETLDEEMEAERDAHNEKMEQLDEELNKYNDIIDAKLQSIDRQESKDGYEKELSERREEIAEIQQKIDVLSLDDSIEAQKKREDLAEQLADKEESLAEFVHNREVELRKQSLNDQREANQEKVDEERDSLQESHDELIDKLEDDREAIIKHYDSIIENEQYWADKREEIINGNLDKIQSEFGNFANELMNLSNIAGTYIEDNINYQLEKAIDLFNEISKIDNTLDKLEDIDPKSNKDKFNAMNDSDYKVFTGTYLIDRLMRNARDENQVDSLRRTGEHFRELGHRGGSDFGLNGQTDFHDMLKDIDNPNEYIKLANYMHRELLKRINSENLREQIMISAKWIRDKGIELGGDASIASFDTGGYTGAWGKSGKLLMAHEKELMLNKTDTKNILGAVDIVRNIASKIPKFSDLKFKTPSNESNTTIHMPVTIQSMSGGEKGANDFLKSINNKLKLKGVHI